MWPRRKSPARSCWALASCTALLASSCGGDDRPANAVHLSRGARGPAPVQFLVPGFEVDVLPVALPNVNNVRYRADGTLVALGYDGRIDLLRDRDGDGLEETVTPFLDAASLTRPVGMALTPPGYPHGQGALVTSVGKVSLILDTDGDDRADREIVLATGWERAENIGGETDAFGAAFDREGNAFFGLGASDFSNPYLLRGGSAHYDRASERGTILRVAADLGGREVVCTGIRFSVGLAFNAAGDLFCTDQEGSTWLANGNPYDELLHVERGRHYGFPPQHPEHLPGVYDEASLWDYGPQHQSTCGLVFNGALEHEAVFGPKFWRDDALVAGFARGRLFRTRVAKTPFGHVAGNATWAVADALPVDQCVSPRGDLVVACHGGEPDWGSGPTGAGTLLKIRYADRDRAQPVLVCAPGPQEVRVLFDRPLSGNLPADFAERVHITHGDFVRAGDSLETKRPGYRTAEHQLEAPRYTLAVRGARLSDDRGALILDTEPHPAYRGRGPATAAAWGWNWFAVRLPAPDVQGVGAVGPAVQLDYTLCGVEAAWSPAPGEQAAAWRGWLPHLDLEAARVLTRGSAWHRTLFERLERRGVLTLRTRLDLASGPRDLLLECTGGFRVAAGSVVREGEGRAELRLDLDGEPLPLEIEVTTGGGSPARLHVGHVPPGAPGPRAVPSSKLVLPWVRAGARPAAPARQPHRPATGDGLVLGREVFRAHCAACHLHRGLGNPRGPDLDHLVYRDRASVVRDIAQPDASIHPDFVTYRVELDNGERRAGFVYRDGDSLTITDASGAATTLPAHRVKALRASPTSTMPAGLEQAMGRSNLERLLDHLLLDPVRQGRLPERRDGWPPPRELGGGLESVLRGPGTRDPRPLRVLLVGAPVDGPGAGVLDHLTWQQAWRSLLARAPDTRVRVPSPDAGAVPGGRFDLVVCNFDGTAIDEATLQNVDRLHRGGAGLVFVHAAARGERVARWTGLHGDAAAGAAAEPAEIGLRPTSAGRHHPILGGLSAEHLRFRDHVFACSGGDAAGVDVLAVAVSPSGETRPAVWVRSSGSRRVFVMVPGLCNWTFNDPVYRLLLFRGMAWAAGRPLDRFDAVLANGADLLPG